MMSGAASNYDVSRLVIGQVIAAVALAFAFVAAWATVATSFQASLPILLISGFYGVMMFASSYVEEEQHFWYWSVVAWLGLIWVKGFV